MTVSAESSAFSYIESAHLGDVCTGNEGATFACKDDCTNSIVSIDFIKYIEQFLKDGFVECIKRLRSVDGNITDVFFYFILNCLIHLYNFPFYVIFLTKKSLSTV